MEKELTTIDDALTLIKNTVMAISEAISAIIDVTVIAMDNMAITIGKILLMSEVYGVAGIIIQEIAKTP